MGLVLWILLSCVLGRRTTGFVKHARVYQKTKIRGVNYDQEMNPIYGVRALNVIKNLVPMDVIGMEDLVRVGNSADGGYNMLDDFSDVSCGYSIGIGKDWSWDTDISSRGIKVMMFDHTIHPPVLKNPLLKFFQYGVSYEDKSHEKLMTLDSMLEQNNNSHKSNMILKMDVEGVEWDILSKSTVLDRFSQIVIEFHWLKNMILSLEKYITVLKALENLNRTHQLIWVHGITAYWVPTSNINLGGIPIPDQIEVTYVKRKDGLKFKSYDNKKKRMDVRNFKYLRATETLIWWIEGIGIDFEGIIKSYESYVPKPLKLSKNEKKK